MTEQPGIEMARLTFEMTRPVWIGVAAELDLDPAAIDGAAACFEELLPELAYLDRADHPMAAPLFMAASALAVHLTLAEHGVELHDFGAAFLTAFAALAEHIPESPLEPEPLLAAADESQRHAGPGEFVFEAVRPDERGVWGMNVLSCGICHLFSKHDAMDLVPYMCASDDTLLSDGFDEGLRRTGTIGLGAHQCDFRFKAGGEPLPLADQYPDRIRIRTTG